MKPFDPSTLRRGAVCCLLLCATVYLDYVTGEKIRLGGIYLAMVALASWNLGLGLLVPYAALTVAAWTTVEWTWISHATAPGLVVWNVCNRLLSVTITAGSLYRVKTMLDRQLVLISELRRTLLEFSRLREIIPVCRFCRKLHLDAQAEANLRETLLAMPDQELIGDICPACLETRQRHVDDVPVRGYFEAEIP